MFYDFSFNGVESTDFDLKIGYIGGGDNDNSSVLSLTTDRVRRKSDNNFRLSSAYSEKPLTLENISVIKSGCKDNRWNYTYEEMKIIDEWLVSSKNGELILHMKDGHNEKMKGMFVDIAQKSYNGLYVGFDLKFESNSPYVYDDDVIVKNDNIKILNVNINKSDVADLSVIAPVIKMTILQDGDLTVFNNIVDTDRAVIKECVNGETITLDSINEIITSDKRSILYNDFNFEFPLLYYNNTTFNNKDLSKNITHNQIITSLPCNIEVKYTPLRIGVGIFG